MTIPFTKANNLSILEQAEKEVQDEKTARIKEKMKIKLRELDAANAVVRGIEMQIADLNKQIEDGTI